MTLCQGASGGCFSDKASGITISQSAFDTCAGMPISNADAYIGDLAYGGAIFLDSSTAAVISETSITNSVVNQAGGGIAAQYVPSLNLSSVSISSCSANQWGGGLSVDTAALTITDSVISGNTLPSEVPFGAGLYLSDVQASILRCSITSNNAQVSAA